MISSNQKVHSRQKMTTKSPQASQIANSISRLHQQQQRPQQQHQQQPQQHPSRSSHSKGIKENKWFVFNAGGTYFMTRRSTLIKLASMQSPLYRVATTSTNVEFDRDGEGAYLIDRDPAHFRVVLNFLRTGRLCMTDDTCEEGVLVEAEYFNVPELARLVQQRIDARRMNVLMGQQNYLSNLLSCIGQAA